MTGLERVMTSLRHEEPDKVPLWELIVNKPVIEALYGDISYLDFCEKEGLDGVTIFETHSMEDLGNDTIKDEWGTIWKIEPNGIPYPIGGPIRDESDLDKYTPPDPDADYRLDALRSAVKRFGGERAIVFLGHETFEFSHYLLGGMDKLLMQYILNPEFCHRLSEIIWAYKGRVLANAADVGADILLTGDDVAQRKATMMSPAHFREFILPYLKKAVDIAHAKGKPFIKHTDGYLWEIMDMMVEAGIDGIDPIEPIANMDIGEVKQKYKGRLAVCGNVDCTWILPHGTKQQVIDAVKETIAKASPGGGHILASSNSIHPGVKPENYRTMVETAREFGTYPLDEKMVAEYRRRSYVKELDL
ncbi:MAG: uroporphyrinogen decarboxylase family protein [Planctomycetota bacterium]